MNIITSNFIILFSLIVIVLPLLVMQVRYFLYFRHERSNPRQEVLEFILEILSYDLLIIGMTLGFASIANLQLYNQIITSNNFDTSVSYFISLNIIIFSIFFSFLDKVFKSKKIKLMSFAIFL